MSHNLQIRTRTGESFELLQTPTEITRKVMARKSRTDGMHEYMTYVMKMCVTPDNLIDWMETFGAIAQFCQENPDWYWAST